MDGPIAYHQRLQVRRYQSYYFLICVHEHIQKSKVLTIVWQLSSPNNFHILGRFPGNSWYSVLPLINTNYFQHIKDIDIWLFSNRFALFSLLVKGYSVNQQCFEKIHPISEAYLVQSLKRFDFTNFQSAVPNSHEFFNKADCFLQRTQQKTNKLD